jgi:hypothetical protein
LKLPGAPGRALGGPDTAMPLMVRTFDMHIVETDEMKTGARVRTRQQKSLVRDLHRHLHLDLRCWRTLRCGGCNVIRERQFLKELKSQTQEFEN